MANSKMTTVFFGEGEDELGVLIFEKKFFLGRRGRYYGGWSNCLKNQFTVFTDEHIKSLGWLRYLVVGLVASQFVITFQFVINYYKLERICNAIASQFVINYYKLERICTAAASQFVINYYKLARICNAFAFQFVIK